MYRAQRRPDELILSLKNWITALMITRWRSVNHLPRDTLVMMRRDGCSSHGTSIIIIRLAFNPFSALAICLRSEQRGPRTGAAR